MDRTAMDRTAMEESTRQATTEDLPELEALVALARAEVHEFKGGPAYLDREARPEMDTAALQRSIDASDELILVGLIDDVIVAFAGVVVVELRTGVKVGDLTEIYVMPDARGVAVARRTSSNGLRWSPGCFAYPPVSTSPLMPEATNGRPELSVGAVAVQDHHLLMIRRGSEPGLGRWSLPGGRVERGETMAEAVVREVMEETGVPVMVGAPIDWLERIGDYSVGEHWHFVIVNFAVTVDGESDPVPGTDAIEAAWIHLDDVAELDLVTGMAQFLADNQIIELYA